MPGTHIAYQISFPLVSRSICLDVISSVLCKEENIPTLEEQLEKIKIDNRFQTGALKSNKVGKNHQRRLRILKVIAQMDCSF